ncbi:MAG: peptidylprolyl isomerase [Planctomycetaceae bacterium]|nr:peptidylprolyl isomerase [Planctomycetaceae bacterium]
MSFCNWMMVFKCSVGLSFWIAVVESPTLAQDEKSKPTSAATTPDEALAYVQGRPIGMAEVRFLLRQIRASTSGQQDALDRWLGQAPADKETAPAEIPRDVVWAAVDQWIERQVVLAFLERQQMAVPRAKVEADLRSWDERLQLLGSSLEAYRQSFGISEESLFQFRHWELSWQSYLDRRVTDDSLQRYYQQFQPEFDGTKKRVAHIVIVIPPADPDHPNGAEERTKLQLEGQRKLEEVREQIKSGSLTFAQAAAKFSQGTTADAGGELGWVVREGPLAEVVSQAVFRLPLGEISQPVVSPHGVHLLTVLEETPGSQTYSQVVERVKQAAMQQLWQKIIEEEMAKLSIERRTGS